MPPSGHPRRPIYYLDSKHTMAMILYLGEEGPSKRMEIYEHVSRNMTMPDKIEILLDRGVLMETPTQEGMKLSLTEAGIQIAEHLRRIESCLSDVDRTLRVTAPDI